MGRGDGVCAQLVVQLCSQRAHGTQHLRGVLCLAASVRAAAARDGCKCSPLVVDVRLQTLAIARPKMRSMKHFLPVAFEASSSGRAGPARAEGSGSLH